MGKKLTVQTDIGTLTAHAFDGTMHPGIYISFTPKNADREYGIVQVEIPRDPDFDLADELQVTEWLDPSKRGKTNETDIPVQSFDNRH